MRKTAILCLVALIGASSACKKKLPASDAVRADLKNYLTVEMPKHQELLHLLTSVSEKFKDADGENKGPREKSDDENKLLTDAVTALKNTKIATDELKRVHSELEQGVEKMQTAFVKIAVVEKQSGAASSVAGTFSAIQDIIQGVKKINDWNEALEAGCKANGLTAEFNDFQKQFGLKTK